MLYVQINDKKYTALPGTPLKELLLSTGFAFPCGGHGQCGKCRVQCPQLPVSDLDRRFLSPDALNEGMRISCDKTIEDNLSVRCTIPTNNFPVRKLEDCRIVVSIGDEIVELGILDTELAETIALKNPLRAYGTLTDVRNAYCDNRTALSNALRALIGKQCVELFEKYGCAKAEVITLAANGTYLKILAGIPLNAELDLDALTENDCWGLPCESLYIVPNIDDYVGGDVLCESVLLPENSLLIDCEETLSFLSVGAKDNVCASVWDSDYTDVCLRVIRAAVRVMADKQLEPPIYLFGRHAFVLDEMIADMRLTAHHRDKDLKNVVSACLNHRMRSKLKKEKERTSVLKLADDETFQTALSES